MAHPQIAAFARLAGENAKPTRIIAGQKTLLSRTMHDIRYDPVHDEFLVTNPFAQAILVFRGGANGEEAPVRIIQGPNTKLNNIDRVDIDVVHNEILVPNRDSILVFPREANGNVAPIREIRGPDTQLGGSAAMAVDPVNNLLVATSRGESATFGSQLAVFNRTDHGNTPPRAVIGGSNTGLVAINQLQMYPPKGWIVVTVAGTYLVQEPEGVFIGGWSIRDNGNVPPRWKIGPKSMLKRPRGIVLVPEHKELIVADMRLNAVLTYYFPEIF